MLKYTMLAGAMTIAAPLFAQTATNPTPTAPTSAPVAATPQTTVPATDPMAAAPAQGTTPVQTATQPTTQVAPASPQTTGTETAQQPAATGSQVAQVVDTEFPTYDKNGDGKLSETEFSAWMVALKTKSDPTTKADSPATKSWVDAAFAQADKDKSKSLTKSELTSFLSKG